MTQITKIVITIISLACRRVPCRRKRRYSRQTLPNRSRGPAVAYRPNFSRDIQGPPRASR